MSKRRNRWQANFSPEDAMGVADVLGPNRSMLVFVGGLGWILLRRWVAEPGEDLRDRVP